MKTKFGRRKELAHEGGFSRADLVVVLAVAALLALVQLSSRAKSREGGHEAVCMNNLRQLGMAMMMYSDQSQDVVAEEGSTSVTINDAGSGNLTYAWYNLAVQPRYARLADLYLAANPPLPNSGGVYSCPACPGPENAAIPYGSPPNFARAFFMYGENGRLCINQTTRSSGTPQTKLSQVPKPPQTILMSEVDAITANNTAPAQSNVTGQYAPIRHYGYGLFSMCDGGVRAARTNEFLRTSAESNDAATEWAAPRVMYWYPTATTPN